MQAKRIVKAGAIVLLVCLVLGGAALGAILWSIHSSVRERCAAAQEAHPHPGDDVSALLDLMRSEAHPLRDRNLAVWTLGRLQDPRALPGLLASYTGAPCDHDRCLCQHELQKAIRRCGGSPD